MPINGSYETTLDDIPKGWNATELRQLANVKYGKARPKLEGDIPVYGSGGIYALTNQFLVDYPTIVVGRKGSAGQCYFVDKPCWISDTCFYLEWKTPVNVPFLAAYMSANSLSGEHAKTTLPSIQKPDLESYSIPLPPLPEQLRIATVLNAIQDEIAAQDDLINTLREFKRSVMARLFTYGAGETLAETKMTEVGEIPVGWELTPLHAVLELHRESYLPAPGTVVPYVGLEHIISGNPRLYQYGSSDEVKSGKTYFYPEQILFGKLRPYLDKCVLVDFEGICSTDILVFESLRDLTIPEFIVFLLHTDRFVKLATDTMTGVNHPRTHWSSLQNFVFPLPPLAEQHRIANTLIAIDDKIAAEEDRRSALQEFFRSMLQQLMTGQIRLLNDEGLPL